MFQDKNNAKPKTGISGLFDKAKNYAADFKTAVNGSGAPADTENAPQEPAKQGNTQEQPEAPLGATWQDRIKNATASDDDIRKAAEEYKAGRYTPGPKTLEEFKKMGLLDEQEQQTTVPDSAQTTTEQTQTQTPEQTQTQTSNVADNTSSNDTSNVDNGNTDGNTDGNTAGNEAGNTDGNTDGNEAETEEKVQEDTNQVKEKLKSKTDDELKDYIARIEESLNTNDEEKSKMAGIFQAYKNGDIDKNQRNYFLADAIARFANNIGEIQDTKNQNALWANITSGNQKSANVDLSPNEWQNFLKTDWQEAQKRKNEAKSKATMEKVQADMEVYRQRGIDKYIYDELPQIVQSSAYNKMDPDERVSLAQCIATMKGAPFNADQLGNIKDPTGNAALANALGDQQLRSAILGNDMQNAQIVAQGIENNVQQAFAMKYAEQQFNSTEEAIAALRKDNQMKDELLQAQKISNDIDESTKDAAKRKRWADANSAAWDGAGIEVNIKGIGKVKVPFAAIQTVGGEAIRSMKTAAKNAIK